MNTIPYPGSKRRSVARILPHLGRGDLLLSPFAGMAAVEVAALESGAFGRAVLGDASPIVVAVLLTVQADPDGLCRAHGDVADYINGDGGRLREVQHKVAIARSTPEIAALALGASCWAFSRLWVRVNGDGRPNAALDPRGRPKIAPATFRRYAAALARAEVRHATWEWIQQAPAGTIYTDPPYLGEGGFTAYTGAGWKVGDACRLADALATRADCRVVVSEQMPGGAHLYHDTMITRGRACEWVTEPKSRNVRGDQIAKMREEVLLVSGVENVPLRNKILQHTPTGVE